VAQEELSLAIADWWAEAKLPPNAWIAGRPPAIAIPNAVTATPSRWRTLKVGGKGWTGTCVAMDLNPVTNPPKIARARLFVVSAPAAKFQVPSVPTTITLSGFAGGSVQVRVWQVPRTNLLYVLVVDEVGGQDLSQFFRKPTEV
jgi:hypothetical protein